MSDDPYAPDPELLAAMASARIPPARPLNPAPTPRVVQPTPQRLDPRPPTVNPNAPKIQQPTPQVIAKPSSSSSILVNTRQKGNPVLNHIKSQPWEYSDKIEADYVLGQTTCALFLSLKYHRLHPEYIYKRIKDLQGKYALRIVLALVDIPNHEEILKELSKTSLINNVTLILCWSAAEGARYLELFKSYEHAPPTGIMGVQARSYKDRVEEFVTTPRGVNKGDAVSLVGATGSVRNAVNAEGEVIVSLGGWGEKKVKAWTGAVREPFMKLGAKRKRGENGVTGVPLGRVPLREMDSCSRKALEGAKEAQEGAERDAQEVHEVNDDEYDDDEAIAAAMEEEERIRKKKLEEQKGKEKLGDGVAAALAKLRQGQS